MNGFLRSDCIIKLNKHILITKISIKFFRDKLTAFKNNNSIAT